MNSLAELFIAIGVKAEGLEQLTAIHERLQQIAGDARNAIKALAELNGIKIAPSSATPASPQGTAPAGPAAPAAPAVAPVAPVHPTAALAVAPKAVNNPSGYDKPIGPDSTDFFVKQQKAKLTAVKQLSEGLNKMALMLGAVSAATAVLIAKSITATMEMANFGLATGMSTAKLQEFQHAAQIGGASGKEMAGLLDSLQTKIQEVRIGEGDISPFALLGLDTSQNPMQMMDSLRAKLATMTDDQKQFARLLAARIGINSTMFASLLRQSKELSKSLVLESSAVASTTELNAAWQDLMFSLSAVRNQIVSALAPTFTFLANKLTWVIAKLAVFSHWLASSSPFARILSAAIALVVVAIGALVLALAAAATAVMGAASVMTVMGFVSTGLATSIWGVVSAAAAAAAPFLIIAGIVAALAIAVDEIIVTFQGGKSVIGELGESIGDLANQFLSVIDPIGALGNAFFAVFDFIPNMIEGIVSALDKIPSWLIGWLGGGGGVSVNPMQSITQAAAQPPSNQPGGKQSSNVSQDIEINVDGSKDPRETAKAVNNGLKSALGNASYQMPAYSV
jgi:hypothetical protein